MPPLTDARRERDLTDKALSSNHHFAFRQSKDTLHAYLILNKMTEFTHFHI